jgi:hypothetical protein
LTNLTRRNLPLALAAAFSAALTTRAFGVAAAAPQLLVRLDGDYLRIALPHLDFLQGKPLDRLKEGASVAFIGQVTVTTSPNSLAPVARSVAKFAFSYDIWEERFSITKIGQGFDAGRSVSHLKAQAAESWCIDNLTVDRSELPADKPFWVQLDLRTEDPRDQAGVVGDPGISITRLIEIFSRPARSASRWLSDMSGPYRLAELKRLEVKGPRG